MGYGRRETMAGLSRLLDREADAREQAELEAALRNDAHAKAVHDNLKRGSSRGREIFGELLKEPVPLDLVRVIRTAPPPRKAVRLPGESEHRPALSMKPTAGKAFAAGLLLFVLGGGLGYLLADKPNQPAQPLASQPGDWLDDVVAHYGIFSRQPDRIAEMPPSDPAAIVEWLLTSTGVNFRIPDLGETGLTFKGARLFAAGGMPVGELLYTSGEGEVIAILFRKNRPGDDGFSERIRDNIALLSWKSATATYVAVGPSSAASLDEIAAKAAGLI